MLIKPANDSGREAGTDEQAISRDTVATSLKANLLFDEGYYLDQNRDIVAESPDPLQHYVTYGASEGRDPHPLFDTDYYLSQVSGLIASAAALSDYVCRTRGKWGATGQPASALRYSLLLGAGRRSRSPRSDTTRALSRDLAERNVSGPAPVVLDGLLLGCQSGRRAGRSESSRDDVRWGAAEGRNPHPYFEGKFYDSTATSANRKPGNPLIDYILHGSAAGRAPSAAFDPARYRASLGESGRCKGEPIAHMQQRRIDQSLCELRAPECPGRPLTGARVTLISGYPDTASEVYRVMRLGRALRQAGCSVLVVRHDDTERWQAQILASTCVVLFRVVLQPDLARLVCRVRAGGVCIVFDVDDYAFEPSIAGPDVIDGIRLLPEPEQVLYPHFVTGVRRALAVADFCTTSTHYLADRLRALRRPAFVVPNSVGEDTIALADILRLESRGRDPEAVVVGYASGTRTHQRDFAVVCDAVVRILKRHPRVRLRLVGHIVTSEFPALAELEGQLEVRPAISFDELLRELAEFDINLAPLEAGNPFCEGKSEIKYQDAALLGIPTIATPTATFARAITHGSTGFLARSDAEWYTALDSLILDARLRRELGSRARQHVLDAYGPSTHSSTVRQTYEYFITEQAQHRRNDPAPAMDALRFASDYRPVSLELPSRPFDPTAMDVHWILPRIERGSGGHMNIFRMIQYLEEWGHRNTVWIHGLTDDATFDTCETMRFVARHFVRLKAGFLPLPETLDQITGDAVIATDFRSAYAARAMRRFRRRFYFIQDDESRFFPAGTEALLADYTYSFGFDALCNGPSLHNIAQERGMWSVQWDQAADGGLYFADRRTTRHDGRIAFYARHRTPRRAVELGLLALQHVHDAGESLDVHFTGTDDLPWAPAFRHTIRGVLDGTALGDLYRECSLGLVLSATNHSIVPVEMLACGLPVFELDTQMNRKMFADCAAIRLLPPDPVVIGEAIAAALADPSMLRKRGALGPPFSSGFSWQRSARVIEGALRSRLQAVSVDLDLD